MARKGRSPKTPLKEDPPPKAEKMPEQYVYREYETEKGNLYLIKVSLDERFGTWPRIQWLRKGNDWILNGIGSSGGIKDPEEAIEDEQNDIEYRERRHG